MQLIRKEDDDSRPRPNTFLQSERERLNSASIKNIHSARRIDSTSILHVQRRRNPQAEVATTSGMFEEHRVTMLLRTISQRFTFSSASALTKRRRFYKDVNVVEEEAQTTKSFKVTLDGRTLKTHSGRVVEIQSEPLALAIAEEWASQEEHIHMGHMRLTGLAFTAIDNPLHLNKESLTSKIMEYLHGDTILFWNNDSEKLSRYQEQYWQPVIDYANKNLGTEFKPSKNLFESPVVATKDARIVEKWLMSYNFWALIGMQYAVESLKSVLLPYSVVTFEMGAEEAVHCATLEQKAQTETWGTVEWAHEVEREDLTSRLAAAALFVYFTSNSVVKSTL